MAPAAAHQNPDRIKDISIIVNVANRTVALMDNVLPITSIMANLVNFSGVQPPPVPAPGMKPTPFSVGGTIDRVAGYASIHWWYEDAGNNTSWKLICSPK
jgi:hypothetical protein